MVEMSSLVQAKRLRNALVDWSAAECNPSLKSEKSLSFVGKYKQGYPLSFRRDVVDPYVLEAVRFIFGRVPKHLKNWSRSGGGVHDVFESIQRYDKAYPAAPRTKAFTEAVSMAYKAFRLPSQVKPLHLSKVEYVSGSSAGFTWLGMKKSDVWELALNAALQLAKLINRGRVNKAYLPPCVTFKRTQLWHKSKKPKVRAVWGFPFEITLMEGVFAQPLIEEFKRHKTPMFIGRHVLKEVPIVIDNGSAIGSVFVTDISGFDAAVPPYGIRICFDILRQNLNMGPEYDNFWDFVIQYFIKTPIVLPNGERYVKHGGVPSGSFFTQLIGSIWNFIVITSTQLELHGTAWTTFTLGDDSLQVVPKGIKIDRDAWSACIERNFDMIMSPTKSQIGDNPWDVDFLGHSSFAGRVTRDPLKVVCLALYPEYPVDDPGESVLRVMMLYADSGSRNVILYRIFKYLLMTRREVHGDVERWMRYVVGMDQPIQRLLTEPELVALA